MILNFIHKEGLTLKMKHSENIDVFSVAIHFVLGTV